MTIEFYRDAPLLRGDDFSLRPWREDDLPIFAEMNADEEVMRFFPSVMSRRSSDSFAEDIQNRFRRWGFSYWALETSEKSFSGFVGLSISKIRDGVEIGWRLHPTVWGNGYATKAARVILNHGFKQLKLNEVISYAPCVNLPSLRVMERLGMRRNPADDFDHPNISPDSALQRCALYRISREQFKIDSIS